MRRNAVLEGEFTRPLVTAFGRLASWLTMFWSLSCSGSAGKEHVDVGGVPGASSGLRGIVPHRRAEECSHSRRLYWAVSLRDVAFRGPRAGCGFGKRQPLHGLSGRRRGVARAFSWRIRCGTRAPWRCDCR